MILVIDTSSSIAAIATINNGASETYVPAQSPRLHAKLRDIARDGEVTKVAVVTGPGSFTGLRVGVSFALGLAMGRRIPIVPLPTLELQAARSDEPVTAVADAGRGRFYFRMPDGKPQLGAPVEIPTAFPLVGRLHSRDALLAAGHRFKSEDELRRLVDAASTLLEVAREVPYRNLEIEYLQSFGTRS